MKLTQVSAENGDEIPQRPEFEVLAQGVRGADLNDRFDMLYSWTCSNVRFVDMWTVPSNRKAQRGPFRDPSG